jgi:acyl carrier protein
VARLRGLRNTTKGREFGMETSEIQSKVVEIIGRYAKNKDALGSVTEGTNILEDLKVNSARLVDVILDFEDEFDIEVEDEDADAVNTIGDAVRLIQSKVA